ncbi:ATP-binding protein [Anaerobacillus alkaliphilus]|uniref:ATP-binding protein n=1 Tax=Anaerobacillus alkaliphilus TaxID=1548597 RepID=A0A4Q0VW25_9BACI|nr:ATP-binding protein [Anaerobacillus alkaliphilus]RXJ03907.1 ATP-binding protein [Anaerobacillus alkaliphilus]
MEHSKRIKIITGHFGSGKTEIAINISIKEAIYYKKVALNDLDVINPYFRSRDVGEHLTKLGVELIAPKGILATADLPIVSPDVYRVLQDSSYRVIIDVGGDKDGATALGQYFHKLKDEDYELLFVINANRPYVSTVKGIVSTIHEIEKVSRLSVTGLINNTNLGCKETTVDTLLQGIMISKEVSETLGIPFLYTTLSDKVIGTKEIEELPNLHYIKRFMKLPWEN